LYNQGRETRAQVAQRDGRCFLPGNIQGQVDGALSNLMEFKMALLMAGGWTR